MGQHGWHHKEQTPQSPARMHTRDLLSRGCFHLHLQGMSLDNNDSLNASSHGGFCPPIPSHPTVAIPEGE